MNFTHRQKALATLLCTSVLASTAVIAAEMSRADYKHHSDAIAKTYDTDRKMCDAQSGNAKDVCIAEAKGKHDVAKAELGYQRSQSAGDRRKLAEARVEATYDVAKEKCDDFSGDTKDICMKEAKAAETRGKADIKAGKEIAEVRKNANEDKMKADRKAAEARCETLAGDAKSACIDQAKTRHTMP